MALVNGGASGVDDGVIDVRWEFAPSGLTGLEVEYLHEGALVVGESISLVP